MLVTPWASASPSTASEHDFAGDGDMPLLWYLRDHAGLTGTKFGCGGGFCGACTVLIDGAAAALLRAAGRRRSRAAPSPPSRAWAPSGLHAVQKAWIEEDVAQCGYCQAGQILAAVDLLKREPGSHAPRTSTSITNLCRCGTYVRIRRAIARAAGEMEDSARERARRSATFATRRVFLQTSPTAVRQPGAACRPCRHAAAAERRRRRPEPARVLYCASSRQPRRTSAPPRPRSGRACKTSLPMILAEELDAGLVAGRGRAVAAAASTSAATEPRWRWGSQGAAAARQHSRRLGGPAPGSARRAAG